MQRARARATSEMTMVPGHFTGTRRGYAPTYGSIDAVSLDHEREAYAFSLARGVYNIAGSESKRDHVRFDSA